MLCPPKLSDQNIVHRRSGSWCSGLEPAACRQRRLNRQSASGLGSRSLQCRLCTTKPPKEGDSDRSTGRCLACWLVCAWFIADWKVLSYKACQQLSGGGHKPAGLTRFQLHGVSCSLSSGLQPNHHCLACCKSSLCLSNNYWHLYCRSDCTEDHTCFDCIEGQMSNRRVPTLSVIRYLHDNTTQFI